MKRKLIDLLIIYRAQERELAAKNLAVLQVRMNQEQEYNLRINKSRQGEIVIYGS